MIFAQSEIEYHCKRAQFTNFQSAVVGGMGGGICQAYTTMGFCTFMKTVDITRSKSVGSLSKSTLSIAYDIIRKEGVRGINKGVSKIEKNQ